MEIHEISSGSWKIMKNPYKGDQYRKRKRKPRKKFSSHNNPSHNNIFR